MFKYIIFYLFIAMLSPSLVANSSFEPTLNEHFQNILNEQILFSGETAGTSVAIESLDGKTWTGTSGFRDLLKQSKLFPHIRFRVGSNTKSMIMAIIMQLVDEKKLSLNDTIEKFLPEYTNWKNIRILDLLGMRSGIKDYIQNKLLWTVALIYPHRYFSPYELLSYVKKDKLLFKPGIDCSYSNTNFIILGLIAEKLTGLSIKELLAERIIKVLNLPNTYLDTEVEEDPLLAHGYIDFVFAGPFVGIPDFFTKFISKKIIINDNIIDGTYLFHNSLTWAAGSMVSSNPDLVTFFKNLFAANLVSSNALKSIMQFNKCLIFNREVDYGLTIMKRTSSFGTKFGHGGLYTGYRTETYYIPSKNLIISQSSNFLPDESEATQRELIDAILNPPKEPEKICKRPDFNIPKEGNILQFRFSGRLNNSNNPKDYSGISNFTLYSSGKRIVYYGLETFGKLLNTEKNIIEINSLAPSHTTSIVKLATLSINKNFIENETYSKIKNSSKISLTLSEAYLNEKEMIEKICVTGFIDFTKGGEIYFCNPQNNLDIRDKIRLFGYSAIETNPYIIAETLKKLGLNTCFCIDEYGKYKSCEPTFRNSEQNRSEDALRLDFIHPFLEKINVNNLMYRNIVNEKIMLSN